MRTNKWHSWEQTQKRFESFTRCFLDNLPTYFHFIWSGFLPCVEGKRWLGSHRVMSQRCTWERTQRLGGCSPMWPGLYLLCLSSLCSSLFLPAWLGLLQGAQRWPSSVPPSQRRAPQWASRFCDPVSVCLSSWPPPPPRSFLPPPLFSLFIPSYSPGGGWAAAAAALNA